MHSAFFSSLRLTFVSQGFASGFALTGLFPYVAFMTVDLGAAENIDSAGSVEK